MGQQDDFSPGEIRFFVQCFEKGWTAKAIEQEIQDTKEFPARPARTIGKIRKIYEAVKRVYEEKFYETAKGKLESQLNEMAKEAIKGQVGLDIRRAVEIIDHMSKGLRPVYDEKTGEIRYETWLEF